MQLNVPDHLWDDFLRFLDIAQSQFTEEDVANFHSQELKVLKLVEGWLKKHLDGGASRRFETMLDKRKAGRELGLLISGQLDEYSTSKLLGSVK